MRPGRISIVLEAHSNIASIVQHLILQNCSWKSSMYLIVLFQACLGQKMVW